MRSSREFRRAAKPDGAGEDWNLGDCLHGFGRRRYALLCFMLAGGVAGLIISCAHPRLYQARAAIEVQYPNVSFLDLLSVYPNIRAEGDLSVQTQVELLRQDSLLADAVRRLDSAATEQLGDGSLSRLREEISIIPVRNTRIVEIVCEDAKPAVAADLANALAAALIERNIQTSRSEARRLSQSLHTQVEELQIETGREPRSLANDTFYDVMLREANRSRLASAAYQPNVRLLAAAAPPTLPHRPNIPLTAAIGIMGGFVAGAGLIMLRKQNSERLHSPGDVARRLALTQLGAAPKVSVAETFLLNEPHASIAEALHSAVTGILTNENGALRTIAITSALAREGKTTILCHLGLALASIGRKTLLIDANLRNPRLHETCDVSNSYGLSDLLRDGSSIDPALVDRAIRKTSVPDLYMLPAGSQTELAFRLFNSGAFEALLGILRQQFEFILVDAPACFGHAETSALVRCADGVALVVSANYASAPAVQKAAESLQRDGACVIGVVMNRIGPAHGGTWRSANLTC